MSVQWTVSFKKDELEEAGLHILVSYEHVEFKRNGAVEIDMEEGDFFNFAEELASVGEKLSTDGSDSWGKHV